MGNVAYHSASAIVCVTGRRQGCVCRRLDSRRRRRRQLSLAFTVLRRSGGAGSSGREPEQDSAQIKYSLHFDLRRERQIRKGEKGD